MIKKEVTYFFTALMFFTRIPVPFKLEYNDHIMNQSQRYYAFVGLIVGAINAGLFYLFHLLFSPEISILLSIAAGILLTGAFHEDGFTDVCDSFGGGYGKEKILTIMKDSRIGAYGLIGFLILFLIKFFAVRDLSTTSVTLTCYAIIAAHTASRFISSTMIYTHQYVTDIDTNKSKPIASKSLPLWNLLPAFCITILSFLLAGSWKFLLVLPFAYLGKLYLGWYFNKYIGGYTGDCLGAVQQVSEVMIYLGFILICTFMP